MLRIHGVDTSLRSAVSIALFVLATAGLPRPGLADLRGVVVDGDMTEWQGLGPAAVDAAGDGGLVDLGAVWLANDQHRLFLRVQTGGEIQPDELQDLRIYLDTDLDVGTGLFINGMGADLIWELGGRRGTFYTPGSQSIGHADVGLQVGPTVSATEFEIAFDRDAVPAAGKVLFPADSVRVVLRDADSGDTLPDSGSLLYSFAAGEVPTVAVAFDRDDPSQVRIASYNVQNDGLFDTSSARRAALGRVFQAIDADLWVISEVWNHDAAEVAAVVEGFLPSAPGESWDALGIDGGNVVVSRRPILESWEVFRGHRLSAVRVDLRPDFDSDLVVVANHWRCCTADVDRQDEADALVAWLRDARTPGGAVTLATGTPVVAAGDFNLVGWRRQLDTLLTGDIDDNAVWGSDAAPDWDGSEFDVVASRHVDARAAYTWRRDTSSFYPGILDWIFYTASVLELHNHFTLDTRTMTAATLSTGGLLVTDTEIASDHAPRVADFALPLTTAVSEPTPGPRHPGLTNHPNPFNPRTEIRFDLPARQWAELGVYDVRGRRVRSLIGGIREAGPQTVPWDGTDQQGREVPSGVYLARLRSEGGEWSRPMVLVR